MNKNIELNLSIGKVWWWWLQNLKKNNITTRKSWLNFWRNCKFYFFFKIPKKNWNLKNKTCTPSPTTTTTHFNPIFLYIFVSFLLYWSWFFFTLFHRKKYWIYHVFTHTKTTIKIKRNEKKNTNGLCPACITYIISLFMFTIFEKWIFFQ